MKTLHDLISGLIPCEISKSINKHLSNTLKTEKVVEKQKETLKELNDIVKDFNIDMSFNIDFKYQSFLSHKNTTLGLSLVENKNDTVVCYINIFDACDDSTSYYLDVNHIEQCDMKKVTNLLELLGCSKTETDMRFRIRPLEKENFRKFVDDCLPCVLSGKYDNIKIFSERALAVSRLNGYIHDIGFPEIWFCDINQSCPNDTSIEFDLMTYRESGEMAHICYAKCNSFSVEFSCIDPEFKHIVDRIIKVLGYRSIDHKISISI